jgi:calcium permeable stress-gated cation channel
MNHFVHIRQHWLISEQYATSAQASTVLIRGVPQRYLSERALIKLFEHLPGGVAKVWLNRNLKDMPDIYERRLDACARLESAETALLNTATKLRNKRAKIARKKEKEVSQLASDPEQNLPLADSLVPKDKRPTHRLPVGFLPFSLPLIGQKVDSIEWAKKEIAETTHLLREQRLTLAKDVATTSAEEAGLPPAQTNHPDRFRLHRGAPQNQTYPPYNSAFILFNKQIAAHMAGQLLTHHEPYRMADRHLGVSPQDIIWDNLNMNPYEARVRIAISWGITLGLIILWAFPVAFVGAVSNIHALCLTYSWLSWVCKLPDVVVGIISGILPPVLLAVLMMLLPIILRVLSRLEGTTTRSDIELSLMTRFFLFQVIVS